MKALVSRWGNSLALRIPKAAVEALALKDGDAVSITEEHGSLRITRPDELDIDAMIAAMRPETFHDDDPWEAIAPVGNEMW
jgi:antitoxin MazE